QVHRERHVAVADPLAPDEELDRVTLRGVDLPDRLERLHVERLLHRVDVGPDPAALLVAEADAAGRLEGVVGVHVALGVRRQEVGEGGAGVEDAEDDERDAGQRVLAELLPGDRGQALALAPVAVEGAEAARAPRPGRARRRLGGRLGGGREHQYLILGSTSASARSEMRLPIIRKTVSTVSSAITR